MALCITIRHTGRVTPAVNYYLINSADCLHCNLQIHYPKICQGPLISPEKVHEKMHVMRSVTFVGYKVSL
jgi:hypothetical protein